MGYSLSGDTSNSLRIYIDAQDRASAEVRKALGNIRKEEQAYQKDSEALDRQKWNATHTGRERDIRDANEYYSRLRAKYDGDAAMQRQIAEAEQARVAQIEEENVGKGPIHRLTALRGTVAGAALIGVAGLAAGMASYRRADDAVGSAKTGEDAVSAIIKREQAKADLLSFVPILGDVYAKIVQTFGGAEGWEKLREHIVKAKADFKDLEGTAIKAVQAAALNTATSFRAGGVDVQDIRDRFAEIERKRALEKAEDTRQSTNRAYIEAKMAGVRGPALADLRKTAVQASEYQDDLTKATEQDRAASARRRQQMVEEEATAFRRSSVDAMMAGVGGPFAGSMRAREDSERRYQDMLKPYEDLAARREELDKRVAEERAKLEEKGYKSNIIDEMMNEAHAEEYSRLKVLEERKTALVAQQAQERARLEQDADTARQRMIEDAMTPVTGAQIREAAIRAFDRQQSDARKGYDQLSQVDKAALDETQRRQKESFFGGLNRQDADASNALIRQQMSLESELSRSREDARKAELDAIDKQLEKDRERLGYSTELVRLAEQNAKRQKDAVNERVNRERDLTVSQLHRAQLDAASSNDQTLAAARARELRAIEADYERQKATARKEDLAEVEKVYQAQKTAIGKKYTRMSGDANTSTAINALRALGLNAGADALQIKQQFDVARRSTTYDQDNVLNAQQRLAEARLRAAGDMPVTRETASQSARFGGTLLRRMPGYDDPSMRMTQEVRDATAALSRALSEFSGVIKNAETITIVKTSLR